MTSPPSLRIAVLIFSALYLPSSASAQDVNTLKTGVVRIENNRLNEVGTGFIIKIDELDVYIVTAAHVVKGERTPKVYLFSQQFKALSAAVLDREEDDTKGLALLLLKIDRQTLSKLTALSMAHTSDLGDGESVKIIGFPSGISLWTVDNGYVKRLEGRNLVLSGVIREGNSGGPVILNGQAVGLVTDVSQSDAYATRAEVVVLYVNGIVKNLIAMSDPPKLSKTNLITNGGFEEQLRQWGTGYEEEKSRKKGLPRSPFWTSGRAEALGTLDSTEHHSGNWSFKIANNSSSAPNRFATISQRIGNLKPYTEYEVSLWIKARNASRLALVLIFDEMWYDRRETPVGSYDWTKLKFRFKTSSDPFADIRLLSENPGIVWFDDVEVYEAN